MYTLSRFNDHNFFNPFHEMDVMSRRLFDQNDNMFRMDIIARDNAYELSADLPGMNKDDIHLDLDHDTLTITAERHSEYEDKQNHGYVRMERRYGSFSRSLDVSAIDTAKINASYTDGVLKLVLPKKQEEAHVTRRLEIQ